MFLQTDPIKIVPKGWGYEKWIVNCDKYCGKILFFYKGRKCSWHYHKVKDEVFYIHSGKLLIHIGETNNIKESNKLILNKNEKLYIPPNTRHRMEALEDTEMYEFSTMHMDNDSYRVIKGD